MEDENGITADEQLSLRSARAADPVALFNASCDRIFLDGKRDIPDFEDRVDLLKARPILTPDVLVQVLETNRPAAIIAAFADDPDQAEAIARMNPVRRAAALASMERGEAVVTDARPQWRHPRSNLGDHLDDKSWSKEFDRKYGMKR